MDQQLMPMKLNSASELRPPCPPFSDAMDPRQFFSGKYPEQGFVEFFLDDGQLFPNLVR
jgi:hypothetical protein